MVALGDGGICMILEGQWARGAERPRRRLVDIRRWSCRWCWRRWLRLLRLVRRTHWQRSACGSRAGTKLLVRAGRRTAGRQAKTKDEKDQEGTVHRLGVEIQAHLVWVRTVAHGKIFLVALVIHPLADHLLVEDIAGSQELVVFFQRAQGLVQRGGQGLQSADGHPDDGQLAGQRPQAGVLLSS